MSSTPSSIRPEGRCRGCSRVESNQRGRLAACPFCCTPKMAAPDPPSKPRRRTYRNSRGGIRCNRRRCGTGRAECQTHQPPHECTYLNRRRGGHQSFTQHSSQNPPQYVEQNPEQESNCSRHRHSASRSTSQSASHLQNHSTSDLPTESPTELLSDSKIRSTSHSTTESPIRSWIQ